MNTFSTKHLTLALLTLLFAGCSSDSPNDSQSTHQDNKDEINLNAQVWQVMQASAPRRAHTYDNAAALQTEAHFTCTAYEANSNPLVAYIPTTTVDWNSTQWQFNNGASHYYWPASGNLDFFAYMPATPPSYISGVDYTAAHNVTFTCSSLPMTYSSATPTAGQGSSLKEFMFGMALAQNKDNAGTGVPLQFQHPFARIKLQLAASHPNVTINSITFRSIKNNGNYNHSASPKWSTSDGATNFVLSLTGDAAIFDNNPASETPIGDYYIMIPQEWTGGIDVNATWDVWGVTKNHDVSTTLSSITWQAGYSYTYTFTITETDLTVNVAKFTEQW